MLRLIFIIYYCSAFLSCIAQETLKVDDYSISYEESIYNKEFRSSKSDTFSYDIKLVFNKRHIPVFYYTELITPVCETGECNLVAIKVFWDLVGGYLGYELPQGRILTKINHKPFTDEDYNKLDRILSDEQWLLADYSINQLISDSTKSLIDSEIDAYTGATVPFVTQENNIEGALYTIYTLWKFVHNWDRINILQNYTLTLLDQNKLKLISFLQSENEYYIRWALNLLQSKKTINNEYIIPLLRIIKDENDFLAYNALQLLKIEKEDIAKELWDIYKKASFSKKRDIINKLLNIKISDDLLISVVNYLSQTENYLELRILIKLINNNKPLSEKVTAVINNTSYSSSGFDQEIRTLLKNND